GTDSERYITDEITGRLLEVRGRGTAVLKPSKDHVFIAFDIHNTPLYVREEMVVAFQGNLKWESGWLRSKSQRLGMLSFRGRGKIFIQLSGLLFNLELPEEEFLLTPMEKLIGWEGYVVAQCNQGELLHAAGSGNLFLRN
ncbi:AIM24 family protein, partial [Myxococcota bacterium]|nr:AIM24 family protein [Myxococcota bacterium]